MTEQQFDDAAQWYAQRSREYPAAASAARAAGDHALAERFMDAYARIDISVWSAMVRAEMTPPRVGSLDELCILAIRSPSDGSRLILPRIYVTSGRRPRRT